LATIKRKRLWLTGVLNPVFDFYHQKNEQEFLKDFVDENIRLAGTETLFIPKGYTSVDSILGEPYQTLYDRFFPLACLLTTPNGYGGDGDMMTQFGLRFMNTSEWVISKRMFRNLKIPDREIRPLEGDLLMIGPSGGLETYKDPQFTYSLMEITYVKHEVPNWALGEYYVFQVVCQLYVASYEKFDTKSLDIDIQNLQYNNDAELSIAINENLKDKSAELLDFSENNPFSGL
jgi:hypothetical protein